MDALLIQNLRYKLQKRIRRLNSVNSGLFISSLRQFWVFFNSYSAYKGIAEILLASFPDLHDTIKRITNGESLVGETEMESAALGLFVIKMLSEDSNPDPNSIFNLMYPTSHSSNQEEALESFREVYIEPFYEYIDEALDDQSAMLNLLVRYKHRSEWFNRTHLWELAKSETSKSEKLLAIDLYSYLHDQGIDFFIEPSSISGEIDLISAQGTNDPLLLDAKIFDGNSRSKTYIRKAFQQIYTYTKQFNEPFGYLIIYKISEKDLHLSLVEKSRDVPVIYFNNKMIFLVVVDIYPNPKPVSQRDPLKVVEITENDFITCE